MPIYDAAYAAKCVHAASAAVAAAENARQPPEANLGSSSGDDVAVVPPTAAARGARKASRITTSKSITTSHTSAADVAASCSTSVLPPNLVSLKTSGTSCLLAVRLVGTGRAGIHDLGSASLSLEALLGSQYQPGRTLELLLHGPNTKPEPAGSPYGALAGGAALAASEHSAGAASGSGGGDGLARFASARVFLAGRVITRDAPSEVEPPPAQRADEGTRESNQQHPA